MNARLARLAWAGVLLAACLAAPALHAGDIRQPVIEPARGGQCIAPPEVMRREHMAMLKHQREITVREGVRGAKVDLQACVDCHASRASGSVDARPQDFCASCHRYVGVKLTCFECHSDKPRQAALVPTAAGKGAQ
jgi:[DsrC]-trisulfide reductase subunit J